VKAGISISLTKAGDFASKNQGMKKPRFKSKNILELLVFVSKFGTKKVLYIICLPK